jgi:hypothetical protein
MSKTAENPNIRISLRSKSTLRSLAQQEGKPMQSILDDAIEQYRRDHYFRELNESFTRLQADPKAWEQELAERQLWDATNSDGLDRE